MKVLQKLITPLAFVLHNGHQIRGGSRGFHLRCVLNSSDSHDRRNPSLSDMLRARIEVMGPMTVADYMRAVLTIPGKGYYMNRDMFGSEGDFITSPEISQLFGEMIGVWFVNELQKFDVPKPWQLIELGPGRGTLMKDILRVFSSFGTTEGLSVHMVEISPELSKLQAKNLCKEDSVKCIEGNMYGRNKRRNRNITEFKERATSENKSEPRDASGMSTITVRRPPGVDKHGGSDGRDFCYMRGVTHDGLPIYWYRSLIDVPRKFSCLIAHEFFDALPVHKFQRTKDGWREMLIAPEGEAGKEKFKYILARSETPASMLLMNDEVAGEHAEVCLEGGLIMRHLGQRVEEDGCISLIADYGHEAEKRDTFRAFCKHKQTDPLISPGSADLTADVDFDYLKKAVVNKIIGLGPITQTEFLLNMGIEARLKVLLENCKEDQKSQLMSGFDMITNPVKMGSRFKFLALFPVEMGDLLKEFPAAGFSPLKIEN